MPNFYDIAIEVPALPHKAQGFDTPLRAFNATAHTQTKNVGFRHQNGFQYSCEWSRDEYGDGSKQPIFLASIDIFQGIEYLVSLGIVSSVVNSSSQKLLSISD